MLKLNLTGHPERVALPDGAALVCAALDHETVVEVLSSAEEGEPLRRTVLRLAEAVIEDWEGIHDDETGEAVAFDADLLPAILADPRVYSRFHAGYAARAFGLVTEGNGSAPSPDGTSAEARDTAPPAKASARNARGASTRPKAAKARRSGASRGAASGS